MSMKLRAWLLIAAIASMAEGSAAEPASSAGSRLQPVPCWFDVPEGHEAECFRFSVPEDRSRADGWVLHLPVAILKTPGGRHYDDPILFLAGGPGFGAWLDRERIPIWWSYIADNPWLQSRDLILFDQRGAGMSDPQLACQELREIALPMLGPGDRRCRTARAAPRGHARVPAAPRRRGPQPGRVQQRRKRRRHRRAAQRARHRPVEPLWRVVRDTAGAHGHARSSGGNSERNSRFRLSARGECL